MTDIRMVFHSPKFDALTGVMPKVEAQSGHAQGVPGYEIFDALRAPF